MDLRPNRTLEGSEKRYKIYLKQLLKEQHLLYKYSKRHQQAVWRKDQTVASAALRDVNDLEEGIRKRNQNSDYDASIHYSHILHDPFITQNHIATIEEGDDDPSLHAAISAKEHHSSASRMFVEGFYGQLLQQISSLSLLDTEHSSQGPITNASSNGNDHFAIDRNNRNPVGNNGLLTTPDRGHPTKDNTAKISHAATYTVARQLLRDMAKGTQDIRQFDDYYALLGYTRHKFIERAMLVVSSLHQIIHGPPSLSTGSHQCVIDNLSRKQWKQRILSVRTMASIGCGPGCDVVGVVAVLLLSSSSSSSSSSPPPPPSSSQLKPAEESSDAVTHRHSGESSNSNDTYVHCKFILDRIVMLDWAMEQWYHPIVQCMSRMLSSPPSLPTQQQQQQQYVQSIICERCDVRQSIEHQRLVGKDFFRTQPMNNHSLAKNDNVQRDDINRHDNEWLSNTDLVVISYLLSETRDAWYDYFDDFVGRSKVGTLFLITDPTAWQLHIFRQRYEYDNSFTNSNSASDNGYTQTSLTKKIRSTLSSTLNTPDVVEVQQQPPQHQRRVLMEFQWLDSSMYRPELQELEGRNGPGVLLAMKVAN